MPLSNLSKEDKEIIDAFFNAVKEKFLEKELYVELKEVEKLLFEDKNYRMADLFVHDTTKRENIVIDEAVLKNFVTWWW